MAHYADKDTGATAWTWYNGEWHDEPVKVMDAIGPGSWLASSVFDGARYFDGVAPDLDLHCQRVVDSAAQFGLKAIKSAEEIAALAWEGIERFARDRSLYIRPMFFAGSGFLIPDPDGTEFALVLEVMEIPEPTGFSACLTRFRRPSPETALTEAKAGALYPNVARCLADALDKGFDNAIVLDGNGNVAEFATANLFLVRNGVAATPVANGTFLAGITRSRVIGLLREAGVSVEERRVTFEDVRTADEVFSTGNYGKVLPCTRVEDTDMQPGPVYRKARELYFGWARSQSSPLRSAA